MTGPSRYRTGLLSAIALLAVTAAIAVTPGHSAEPRLRPPDLTGQLLVATADMPDPRFAQTVIYMIRHDETGAQGLVVNRPIREVALAMLLGQMGMETRGVQQTVRLHAGGPVDTLRILVLHTAGYASDGTLSVRDGYAGWGPGQLEAEMKNGHWVRASADEAVLFDANDETKWDRAMARRKIDL